MSKIVDRIRKAIVTGCMAEGIEDRNEILLISAQAINTIGTMSVAAYKAHATMASGVKCRRKSSQKKLSRKQAALKAWRHTYCM